MATRSNYPREEITKGGRAFSASRTTIETTFYGNNVEVILDLQWAYDKAKTCPGTIETDMPVFEPLKLGLQEEARVLLFNDGASTARFAGARVILGSPGVDEDEIDKVIREVAFQTRYKKMYHTISYIGLDKDFMVRAHLLIPEGYEDTLYNWLLNFQYINDEYDDLFRKSVLLGDEPDIFILADPDYIHPGFPEGLAYFDPEHNCACILGMRYFGEFKKATLTLAWGIANRNGYAACHGGLKRCLKRDGSAYVMAVFGLSGSGKSTLTHAKHNGKYEVTILHDDAYIISSDTGCSIALEPSYFDTTKDYPLVMPDNKYLISVQNMGATIDSEGKIVIVPEDIRNKNGRAIKSRLWTENRVDKMEEATNSIVWLMKDTTLPPVIKVEDPVLASVMGASLASKRSSAEKLAEGTDPEALVFEPYANPFRTYELGQDYEKFKYLFEHRGIENYIINTGYFLEKKIPKEVSIAIIEAIIDGNAIFRDFGPFSELKTLDVEGYVPDFDDKDYVEKLRTSMAGRAQYLESLQHIANGRDALPLEAKAKIEEIIGKL